MDAIVFKRLGETVSGSRSSVNSVNVLFRVDEPLSSFSPLFEAGMSPSPTK